MIELKEERRSRRSVEVGELLAVNISSRRFFA